MPSSDRAAIWGFGREGRAAFRHLARTRPDLDLTILDDAPLAEIPPGARALSGDDAMRALAAGDFSLVVKSPGVSLYRPEITAAKAKGARFTSGVNLWFEAHPQAKTIVVTGTKGKSTTSRLVHHLLTAHGLRATLLGNVGVAALEEEPGADWTVFELSSYQLADFEHAADIALVTNLYPEHAPWHGGVEPYYRDKLNALRDPQKTLAVANRAHPELVARVAGRANLRWFNDDAGFHERNGRLFHGRDEVTVTNLPLRGAHNIGNLAAACTVAELAGVQGLRDRVDLAGFAQLPHRLEEFAAGDVTCVDDSISTVPQAAIAALAAYAGREIVLLAGGTDRGQDYAELAEALVAARPRAVILMPVTGARLRAALAGSSLELIDAGDLAEAVEQAMRLAPPGGVVLLSPAAPSFEEFRNFEERGRRFKELCGRFARRA